MSNIKIFENKKIRSAWNETDQKWYFSVADVVEALTDSYDAKQYVKRMRQRDPELNSNWGTICTPLEMTAADGKRRKVLCANVEGLLRIIQSIPSSKAEPFKRWLAKVGYERLQEIENPELAAQRMREIYRAKAPARRGSRSECAALPFEMNSRMNGKKEASKKAVNSPFSRRKLAKQHLG